MSTNNQSEPALACNLDALDAGQQERHQQVGEQVWAVMQEVKELANGYAFRLPAEAPVLLAAAEFISLERLCCPFFTFVLEVGPEHGPIWLQLTGPDGVKRFLQTELGL